MSINIGRFLSDRKNRTHDDKTYLRLISGIAQHRFRIKYKQVIIIGFRRCSLTVGFVCNGLSLS